MLGFSNRKRKKIALYTAIYSEFKKFHTQPLPSYVDYYVFSDSPPQDIHNSEYIYYPSLFNDPVRSAKVPKIFPHLFLQEYESSIWIDSSVEITNIDFFTESKRLLKKHDLVTIVHPDRDCIYDELEACIEGKRDDPCIMREQIAKYRKLHYPRNNGLSAAGILARNHNNSIKSLSECWWSEISNHSRRDQLSLNYCIWEMQNSGGSISHYNFDINLWDNNYFRIIYR